MAESKAREADVAGVRILACYSNCANVARRSAVGFCVNVARRSAVGFLLNVARRSAVGFPQAPKLPHATRTALMWPDAPPSDCPWVLAFRHVTRTALARGGSYSKVCQGGRNPVHERPLRLVVAAQLIVLAHRNCNAIAGRTPAADDPACEVARC